MEFPIGKDVYVDMRQTEAMQVSHNYVDFSFIGQFIIKNVEYCTLPFPKKYAFSPFYKNNPANNEVEVIMTDRLFNCMFEAFKKKNWLTVEMNTQTL